MCSLCKSKLDRNYNIINYEIKDYIYEKHNEPYVEYFVKSNKDICLSCEVQHNNNETIFYKNIRRDINKVKNGFNEYKKEIDIFNNFMDGIISRLEKIKENMEIYYNNNMIKNYEVKNRNYNKLNNINEINNNIKKNIRQIMKIV